MKKIIIAAFAIALPVIASAQVQLMSGYNFGQFIGGGYPALDGTTGDPVGSIGSNYRLNVPAPLDSDGAYVGNNATTGGYSNGYGRVYFDGTNGSSLYSISNGIDIIASDVGSNGVNTMSVQGNSIMGADGLNLALTSQVANNRIAFVQNTLGFADYDHTLFANGMNVISDQNLTFAATVTAPVTINWYLNGSTTSFASTLLSGGMAVYSLDLDASFFGLSAATLVAEFTGIATLDNVMFNGVMAAVPEPATYAAILGAFTLGFAALRRKKAQLLA